MFGPSTSAASAQRPVPAWDDSCTLRWPGVTRRGAEASAWRRPEQHRARAANPKERRLQRLASTTVADNRISCGCINVPAAFYDSSILPLFADRTAIVYVLPETRPAQQVFNSYSVDAQLGEAPDRAIRLSRRQ